MTEVSADAAERSRKMERRARKNESEVLKALAETGQAVAARDLGVHESTVSRMKDGEIERFCSLLAAVGLKVVPMDYRCVNPEIAKAQMVIYKAMAEQVDLTSLLWSKESEE